MGKEAIETGSERRRGGGVDVETPEAAPAEAPRRGVDSGLDRVRRPEVSRRSAAGAVEVPSGNDVYDEPAPYWRGEGEGKWFFYVLLVIHLKKNCRWW